MTAQPSSQAEREDVARILAEAGVTLWGDALDRLVDALVDREHATPRSMPEEVRNGRL